jgi:hypothetical protein
MGDTALALPLDDKFEALRLEAVSLCNAGECFAAAWSDPPPRSLDADRRFLPNRLTFDTTPRFLAMASIGDVCGEFKARTFVRVGGGVFRCASS